LQVDQTMLLFMSFGLYAFVIKIGKQLLTLSQKESRIMFRQRNTRTNGGSFSAYDVESVWQKGQIQPGYDPRMYRTDQCGAWMERSAYGTTTKYGWEIDHMVPVSKGGSDALVNLQPLHWANNRGKGDNYPHWYCTVPSKV